MYHIKTIERILQSIALNKLKWIMRLRLYIHANDFFKPGTVVSHGCTAGTAKQIK